VVSVAHPWRIGVRLSFPSLCGSLSAASVRVASALYRDLATHAIQRSCGRSTLPAMRLNVRCVHVLPSLLIGLWGPILPELRVGAIWIPFSTV